MKSELKLLTLAQNELGVHEISGEKSEERIIEYHKHTSLKATSDEIPWCSSFVCFVVDSAGLKSTNNAAARSWLNWGLGLQTPVEGCIVVLKRGNPPNGHVGFFVRNEGINHIIVLGGNQNDKVSYSKYLKSDVLDYRISFESVVSDCPIAQEGGCLSQTLRRERDV